jgi:hypothetical protein
VPDCSYRFVLVLLLPRLPRPVVKSVTTISPGYYQDHFGIRRRINNQTRGKL